VSSLLAVALGTRLKVTLGMMLEATLGRRPKTMVVKTTLVETTPAGMMLVETTFVQKRIKTTLVEMVPAEMMLAKTPFVQKRFKTMTLAKAKTETRLKTMSSRDTTNT
jgi:hypothetical protein